MHSHNNLPMKILMKTKMRRRMMTMMMMTFYWMMMRMKIAIIKNNLKLNQKKDRIIVMMIFKHFSAILQDHASNLMYIRFLAWLGYLQQGVDQYPVPRSSKTPRFYRDATSYLAKIHLTLFRNL
uniref:Uncharacterized protein n=1 Tax=Cacopsylla melanoneura TaxID=428564 RepID=A0A8D9EU94_9HEMI